MEKRLNIQWIHKQAKVSDLKEWKKNPRKLTEEKYRKLVSDIQEFGFHDVLKIDTDGTILSGHQRKRALLELGIEEVGVLFPDRSLTEKEREIISIASNRQAGTFDFDILGNEFEFESLKEGGFEDFELGFATTKEEEGKDSNPLAHSMEVYLEGNVKQVSFFFDPEEFEVTLPRLDRIMTEKDFKSHKEVLIFLLDEYENNNSEAYKIR